MIWDDLSSIAYLRKLTFESPIGNYSHAEITEIFAIKKGDGSPVNIFTLIVAEDLSDSEVPSDTLLTNSLINLTSLRGWGFGIKRTFKPIDEIINSFEAFQANGVFNISGKPLSTGSLSPSAPIFSPPNTATEVYVNNVIKNNYWNGSYLIEWFDQEKSKLQFLIQKHNLIQELSEAVHPYFPINIAKCSDRIGNVIIQIPVTAIEADFNSIRETENFEVSVFWHKKFKPRLLRVILLKVFDGNITSFFSQDVMTGKVNFPMLAGSGDHHAYVWDDINHVLLKVSSEFSFLESVNYTFNLSEGDRTFIRGSELTTIPVFRAIRQTVGQSSNQSSESIQKRIYTEERKKLAEQRKFVQYRVNSHDIESSRNAALSDIRWLINQHGIYGVWLWDPFLSSNDILDTLFFTSTAYLDLRAITSCKIAPDSDSQQDMTFIDAQRKIFSQAGEHFSGLKLEFRARANKKGWPFHDRFLIFPDAENGATAWSLGTSINSLGKHHHILQQVGDGQLIADAFIELWNELNFPENIIWKV